MEENKNLTAERSLEIITEQIEQSRRTATKTTGKALYVAGNCTILIAAVIAIVNRVSGTPLGHLLWLVSPVVYWLALRNVLKSHQHEPASLVGSLVAKTWWTYAIFVLVFFVIAILWNTLGGRMLAPDVIFGNQIHVAPTIMLLMGMSVAMTGHILKQCWLVVFGIVAGLGLFAFEHLGIGNVILLHLIGKSPEALVVLRATLPCLSILILAFFGLTLPGWMLKNQK